MELETTAIKRYGKDAAYLLAFIQQARKEHKKGAFKMSMAQLEKDCGLSRYVLKRTLQVLESEGLMTVKRISQKSRMIIELLD